MKMKIKGMLSLCILLLATVSLGAEIHMTPDFRMDKNALFADGADWEATKGLIDVYKIYIRELNDADPERSWILNVSNMVSVLDAANIEIAVEAGGLYGSLDGETGARSAAAELAWIDRIYAAGGRVKELGLDGPISRVIAGGRQAGQGGATGNLNYTLEESVDHLVVYLQAIHAQYPDIQIGLISNFPWWDFQGYPAYFGTNSWTAGSGYEYDEVLDAVLAAVAVAGEEMAFIHADNPYDYYTVATSPHTPETMNDPAKLLALESYCRTNGISYGLVYNSEARSTQGDQEFHEETLEMLDLHHTNGGRPDDYIVQSWYTWPAVLLPDSQAYSFTYLAKAFANRINAFGASTPANELLFRTHFRLDGQGGVIAENAIGMEVVDGLDLIYNYDPPVDADFLWLNVDGTARNDFKLEAADTYHLSTSYTFNFEAQKVIENDASQNELGFILGGSYTNTIVIGTNKTAYSFSINSGDTGLAGDGFSVEIEPIGTTTAGINQYRIFDLEIIATMPATTNGTTHSWLKNYYPGLATIEDYEAQDITDTDNDGFPAWQEYRAGTDPTDPLSRLAFNDLVPVSGSGQLVLAWASSPGRNYGILSRPDLAAGNWEAIISNIPSIGSESFYTTAVDSVQGFYKIRVE